MKPAPFDYVAPLTLDEALATLAEHGSDAAVLAGGQSLVPALNLRLARPGVVVDINRIAGLGEVKEDSGTLVVGATARQRAVERDPVARERAPLLADALAFVAHPAIRTRGTVCGSLTHADPAAELPAVAVVLDATLVLERRAGRRSIAARDFFTGWLTNARDPDELVVEVRVPPAPAGAGTSFVEIARRHGDFALVGVAALLAVRDGIVDDLRLAVSGVDGVPRRFEPLELAARGAPAVEETYRSLAADIAKAVEPQSDLHASAEHRRRLVGVLVRRALAAAAGRAA